MTDRPENDQRPEMQRLFVAIELPPAWLEAFRQHTEAVRATLAASPETRDARVRWVRPEGVHLTLKFLGGVPAEQRPGIEAVLSQAAPAPPDLRLGLGAVGSFADRRAPRVLWVGVGGQTRELTTLAGRIDSALASLGFEPERRPFAPHLTLARLPDDMPGALKQRVVQIATQTPLPDCDSFVVREVLLVRSHLGPGGARYEIVGSWP